MKKLILAAIVFGFMGSVSYSESIYDEILRDSQERRQENNDNVMDIIEQESLKMRLRMLENRQEELEQQEYRRRTFGDPWK